MKQVMGPPASPFRIARKSQPQRVEKPKDVEKEDPMVVQRRLVARLPVQKLLKKIQDLKSVAPWQGCFSALRRVLKAHARKRAGVRAVSP